MTRCDFALAGDLLEVGLWHLTMWAWIGALLTTDVNLKTLTLVTLLLVRCALRQWWNRLNRLLAV